MDYENTFEMQFDEALKELEKEDKMNRITPDWQLDRMYEKETDRLLDRQEAHDKAWDRAIESVGYINVAIDHMKNAIDSMVGAKAEVEDLPCEYKVGSLVDELEDLLCDVESLREKFIEGDI
jgi:Mn-containing catalase